MRLLSEPESKTQTKFEATAESSLTSAQQLQSAREADTAWRAQRDVRVTETIARLRRCSRLIERWLWGLAVTGLLSGTLLLIRAQYEPPDLGWGLDFNIYEIAGHLCLMGFMVLVFAALASGLTLNWVQRRLRSRALADGVKLED